MSSLFHDLTLGIFESRPDTRFSSYSNSRDYEQAIQLKLQVTELYKKVVEFKQVYEALEVKNNSLEEENKKLIVRIETLTDLINKGGKV